MDPLAVEAALNAQDIGEGVLATLAYAGVGLALLVGGYLVLDLLTPGKLGNLVYVEHNKNASRMVIAHLIAVTLVIVSAAVTSFGGTFGALLDMAVFGALAILLQAVAFKVLDVATPGHLGKIVTAPEPCPASTVAAAWSVAVGVVLAVAII